MPHPHAARWGLCSEPRVGSHIMSKTNSCEVQVSTKERWGRGQPPAGAVFLTPPPLPLSPTSTAPVPPAPQPPTPCPQATQRVPRSNVSFGNHAIIIINVSLASSQSRFEVTH